MGGRNRKVAEAFAKSEGKRWTLVVCFFLLKVQGKIWIFLLCRLQVFWWTWSRDVAGPEIAGNLIALKGFYSKHLLNNHLLITELFWVIYLIFSFLKGVLTASEVYEILSHHGWLQSFPLFRTVHEICTGHLPPAAIVRNFEHKPEPFPVKGLTASLWVTHMTDSFRVPGIKFVA